MAKFYQCVLLIVSDQIICYIRCPLLFKLKLLLFWLWLLYNYCLFLLIWFPIICWYLRRLLLSCFRITPSSCDSLSLLRQIYIFSSTYLLLFVASSFLIIICILRKDILRFFLLAQRHNHFLIYLLLLFLFFFFYLLLN
jgi:hypothetical protein